MQVFLCFNEAKNRASRSLSQLVNHTGMEPLRFLLLGMQKDNKIINTIENLDKKTKIQSLTLKEFVKTTLRTTLLLV